MWSTCPALDSPLYLQFQHWFYWTVCTVGIYPPLYNVSQSSVSRVMSMSLHIVQRQKKWPDSATSVTQAPVFTNHPSLTVPGFLSACPSITRHTLFCPFQLMLSLTWVIVYPLFHQSTQVSILMNPALRRRTWSASSSCRPITTE